MPGNSFGHSFRITTAGESHGPGNIVIIDGCPPGLPVTEEEIASELKRRRPGQNPILSTRNELDQPEILAGVYQGQTTGTSIAILIRNFDQKSQDYKPVENLYRPGHADYTFDKKYGFRDPRGGGRSSARETVARVAAGVIAKKILAHAFSGQVLAYTLQIGDIRASISDPTSVSREQIEKFSDGSDNWVRCPDPKAAKRMISLIEQVQKEQDSVGGITEIIATSIPPGLGEPVFDKLKADLGKALFSLPAVVGVEYGAGFASVVQRGSQNNDSLIPSSKNTSHSSVTNISFAKNDHGGILGGISSGMPIVLRVAVKPPSSIAKTQNTVDAQGNPVTIQVTGRHDPCVLPRFAPIAEAMVAIVFVDHFLRFRSQMRLDS